MRYRLIDAITIPVTLRMFPETRKNGSVSYTHYQVLEPGKLYETEDPAQIQYLKDHKQKVRYTAEIENALKACGADYEIVYCKTCGGKRKDIEYHDILGVEDDE